jgi:hypothetical protein
MISKTMEWYVLHTLIEATTITTTIDLCMSQKGFDIFVLVVNYINKKWETCHITIRMFYVHETTRVAMAMQNMSC